MTHLFIHDSCYGNATDPIKVAAMFLYRPWQFNLAFSDDYVVKVYALVYVYM